MPKLLSTAYFPPVSYFAAMAQEMGVVYIETCENYQKQSYRNRCRFFGADGVQTLSFPVVHEGGTHKLPISEIKVDWSKPWPQQHKKALISAYHASACFEYYQDELFAILDSRPERLIDLNMALLRFFIEKIGLPVEIRTTSDYSREGIITEADGSTVICEDLREKIHPKHPNTILEDLGLKKPYFQVFAQKHGFQPDLSIMDLLFNEGPESIHYLKRLQSR